MFTSKLTARFSSVFCSQIFPWLLGTSVLGGKLWQCVSFPLVSGLPCWEGNDFLPHPLWPVSQWWQGCNLISSSRWAWTCRTQLCVQDKSEQQEMVQGEPGISWHCFPLGLSGRFPLALCHSCSQSNYTCRPCWDSVLPRAFICAWSIGHNSELSRDQAKWEDMFRVRRKSQVVMEMWG